MSGGRTVAHTFDILVWLQRMDFTQSVSSLAVLSVACVCLAGASQYVESGKDSKAVKSPKLERLHYKYLATHALIRLADWLQGTNMYTLYSSYGVDVGTLFMTGFITSAIVSTFVGNLVDRKGRKFGCLVYCALEIFIQFTEHVNDFRVLFLGRILGGISTCLLFSSFESWLVGEHRKAGYSEEVLGRTFSYASTINGITAVLAGLIAKVAHMYMGEIGPFDVSLVITFICTFIIWYSWAENYGDQMEEGQSHTDAFKVVRDPTVFLFGIVHAGFEGAMYTFVFLWVPTLLNVADGEERPPTEIIFSCLMVCISIGGILFNVLLAVDKVPQESVGVGICFVAFATMYYSSMILTSSADNHSKSKSLFVGFCVFETLIGIFEPWMSIMRSRFIPNSIQATLMNWFRIPLNCIVGLGVYATDNYPAQTVFKLCATIHLVCCLAMILFFSLKPKKVKEN